SAFEFGERAPVSRVGTSLATTIAARVRPEFTPRAPRRPVQTTASDTPQALPPRQAQKVAPLTLARYFLHYQADTRQSVPAGGVQKADGAPALANHPLEGAGPWFSSLRPDWHRRQLTEIRRAGVDAILPVYRPALNGEDGSRKSEVETDKSTSATAY